MQKAPHEAPPPPTAPAYRAGYTAAGGPVAAQNAPPPPSVTSLDATMPAQPVGLVVQKEKVKKVSNAAKKVPGKKPPQGRPPRGNESVGMTVTYNHEDKSWVAANGYFWHGVPHGGWKQSKPDPHLSKARPIKRRREDQKPGEPKPPQGRPPRGSEKVGMTVTFNHEHRCWWTGVGPLLPVGPLGPVEGAGPASLPNGPYYWHGVARGGWKKVPKGQVGEEEDLEPKTKKPRGRPPQGNDKVGQVQLFDQAKQKWKSDKNFYWCGVAAGGWKQEPDSV